MSASPFSPLPTALDLRALAQRGQALAGVAGLVSLSRVADDLPALSGQPLAAEGLTWQVAAEWRSPLPASLAADAGGRHQPTPQLWLHLQLQTRVPQTCQRCLAAFAQPVDVDRWFRFVADEATALAEDDEAEEDLLVFQPRFDLHALVEDELLLALPLVPMHVECPTPVRLQAGEEALLADDAPPAHPFAALAAIKGRSERS